MLSNDLDEEIGTAACIRVRRMLDPPDAPTSMYLARGFLLHGERIPHLSLERGILNAQQTRWLL